MKDKTLIGFKIRSTRKTRQVWGLVLMLFGLAGVLGAIGIGQYALCQREHPGRSLRDCLRFR